MNEETENTVLAVIPTFTSCRIIRTEVTVYENSE
jgi:hypothetical protein